MQSAHSKPGLPESNQLVAVPAQTVRTLGNHALLRGLMVLGGGFHAGRVDSAPWNNSFGQWARFFYCVKGHGWCEVGGRLQTIAPGDLLILPPGLVCHCGTRASDPWSAHWAAAAGALLPDYLQHLAPGDQAGLLALGEDPQLVRLFNEIQHTLQRGHALPDLLRASHALGHLLALLIQKRQERCVADVDSTQKIAEAIIYMSEHLDQTVRVSALARAASLSPAYFSALFKQQTGCSPREYLHLLRIHRACQLLRTTGLSVKQIASRIGYQDPFHFSRQFKAFQGVAPTQYRGEGPV